MRRGIAAAIAAILLGTPVIHAEEPAALLTTLSQPVMAVPQTKTPLRDAIARTSVRPAQRGGPMRASPPAHLSRGASGAMIGALAGIFAGGTIGWALTKNCHCDDPGMGAVYGLPIGGIVGGLLGYHLLK